MLTKNEIEAKIMQGEGLNVEFKTAPETLPRNVFETICAFLNRKGGYIFLGVKDNGKIGGIREEFMAFVRKHTPDRFYLEGDVRLSIRDIIFREMIVNMLIHREFYSYFRSTLTVYRDTVVAENGNIPYTMGLITPENLKPHTKNPTVFGFFKQLHWADDLGSGVRNMYKYCPIYVKGSSPILEENDIFRQTVRYEDEKKYGENEKIVLALLRENPNITANEMVNITSLSLRTIRNILADLTNQNIIERQGARKGGIWIVRRL